MRPPTSSLLLLTTLLLGCAPGSNSCSVTTRWGTLSPSAPLFGEYRFDHPDLPLKVGRFRWGRILELRLDHERDGRFECTQEFSWSRPASPHTRPQSEECDFDGDGYAETTLMRLEARGRIRWRYCVDENRDGTCDWIAESMDEARAGVGTGVP